MIGSSHIRATALAGLTVGAALALAPTAAAQALEFAAPANYATGGFGGPGVHEQSSATAEFDGDGDADVVVADYYWGTGPFLMRNRGDGTFQSPGRRINVAPLVGTVLAGDVNGDGRQDLIATNVGKVFVRLGRGDGTFTNGPSYGVPQGGQEDAVLADANGDGDLDVIVITRAGVKTLLGRGDGSFTDGPFSAVPAVFPASLDDADFDGDGRVDVVFSDGGGQQVHALRGSGNGAFTVAGTGVTGWVPATVHAGDFDGDGIDDVAALNEFNVVANAAVLISDGTGGFEAADYYDGGLGPATGELGDLDQDGNLDIVASDAAGSKEVVLRGDGAGGFAPAGKFAVAAFPQTPVVTDLDGDGLDDIAAGAAGAGATVLSVLRQLP